MNTKKIPQYVTFLLPLQILFVSIVSKYPKLIESYYSIHLYPTISKVLRLLFGWIPFSFGDVLGVLLISLLVYGIYKVFKNKCINVKSTLFNFTALLSVLYACFYFFWGFNYFRAPLAAHLKVTQKGYTIEQLIATTHKIVTKLNQSHYAITNNDTVMVVNPYKATEIYKKAPDGFKILAETYPFLAYKIPSIKNSLVSFMHMYTGTSGYFNPITGEAQVNDKIPKTGFPATTCHEMAHQIGWSAENDANFVGFLTATANPDPYFKYAGFRMAFYYLIRDIKKHDEDLAKEIWKKVHKGIAKDFKAAYAHWEKYNNPMEPYLKKIYGSYLKANKQSKGIQSYSYVVDLLIAYDTQKGIE